MADLTVVPALELLSNKRCYENVYAYLNKGGYFIFDILNEKEVPMEEPIDLDFSEEVKAQFMVTHDEDGHVNLKTVVFENGIRKFEENIKEIVHDEKEVCALLKAAGFQLIQCEHQLLKNQGNCSSTWYVIAVK